MSIKSKFYFFCIPIRAIPVKALKYIMAIDLTLFFLQLVVYSALVFNKPHFFVDPNQYTLIWVSLTGAYTVSQIIITSVMLYKFDSWLQSGYIIKALNYWKFVRGLILSFMCINFLGDRAHIYYYYHMSSTEDFVERTQFSPSYFIADMVVGI